MLAQAVPAAGNKRQDFRKHLPRHRDPAIWKLT
jgi:hypothetical protein